MLDQLAITKTLDEMAEANQTRQDGHHPRVSEARCWGIETIFTIGRSGDLVEGHHVGGWQSVCAFGVTQAPVGEFANSPEGIPVGHADPAPPGAGQTPAAHPPRLIPRASVTGIGTLNYGY
jgi:hypothetical protein